MKITALTDIGLLRKSNQDIYAFRESETYPNAIVAVCDGMGGAAAGNVASMVAVNHFIRVLEPMLETEEMPPVELFYQAVDAANTAVFEMAQQDRELEGMGTTLVAAYICGNQARLVNVGDSRVYGINKNGIQQITRDHSLVQMMVERGELKPEQAKSYPGKNFITRAIGTEPIILCDLYHQDAEKGDYFLLCSDGLRNVLDDQEILFEVVHGVNKARCCERLLSIAKKRGAPDNVTSVLVLV